MADLGHTGFVADDRIHETPWLTEPLPARVETERLVLRLWQPEDVEAMATVVHRSLDHLRPFMAWVLQEPITLDRRHELVAQWRGHWEAGGDAGYGVFLGDEAIGACGLHCRQGVGVLEIGYWIAAEHNGRGYATELTRALAETALGRPDVESVMLRTDEANAASQRVAVKAGFRFARRQTFPPLAPADSGVEYVWRYLDLPGFTVRPEEPADLDGIDRLVAEAFGSPLEARLVRDIRASSLHRPGLALVAEIDGDSGREIVGHVMISGCTLRTDPGVDIDIVTLAPLAVAPAHQGRGVGAALVWEVLERARAEGEPLVVVLGAPDYYGRFGFEPAADCGITLPVPDWAPPEAGQAILFDPSRTDLQGTVVYPPAFDDLD
jgi:putative acetyltransferase